MPRKYEITAAFNDAIKLDAKSRRGVRTNDFRLVPENYIHHQPLEEYNRWIKRYQAFLFELVTDGGKNKTCGLRNMGYVK